VLALYSKAIKKMFQLLKSSKEAAIERALPQVSAAQAAAAAIAPHAVPLDRELEEGAQEWTAAQREKLASLKATERAEDLAAENLSQYAIAGEDEMFEKELGGAAARGVVQVASRKDKGKEKAAAPLYKKGDKEKGKAGAAKGKRKR